ncbi:MAG: acyl-CoA dehydrogenase family protein, partial [Tepidiformaceae bacterium]
MDFRLSTEQQAFQDEVTGFVESGLPAGWDGQQGTIDERMAVEREVMRRLADRRWLALPWPKEYGGTGATPMEQLIFNEQMAYHRVPGYVNMGVAWVGPVVMLYGT